LLITAVWHPAGGGSKYEVAKPPPQLSAVDGRHELRPAGQAAAGYPSSFLVGTQV